MLVTFLALEFLMSFSFLGYLHVEPISITTAYIPVLLAGALIGPLESAAVGTAFGLASMWKATASYVMATDQLFSPFASGTPLGSLVLSVGSRALFGLLMGVLYLAARRLPCPTVWVGVASYLGKTIHAVLVYTAMALFFPEAGFHPGSALNDLLRPTSAAANAVTAILVLLGWFLYHSRPWQQFQSRVGMAHRLPIGERYHRLSLAVVTLVTLVSALAVTFYFVHRIDSVLDVNGISLSDTGYADVLHLQMQFLFGIVSMMVLVVVFLIFNRRYATYMASEGKLDALTGVMTRKVFFQACSQALQAAGRPLGYFIMVDLDYFKEINDSHGHPEGDRALREVARALREIFFRDSFLGRMGGDEFAVLLYGDTAAAELEVDLRHFLERIHKVSWGSHHLTCSVGALQVTAAAAPEELYREADRLLYLAKERGRNRYVIGTAEEAEASPLSPAANG